MFIALQYLLPQHILSRLGGRLCNSKIKWLKNRLIHAALSHYSIDMQAAKNQDPYSFACFNDFFTRELANPAASYFPPLPQWGAPAEGVLSQSGLTQAGNLIQAKGKEYSVDALLAHHPWVASLQNGSFATIYLAPHNYHRVHSPIAGKITEVSYIPGKLFSVNLLTASKIDSLFAKNERLIFYIESDQGRLAFVMVGALMVAGMKNPFKQWSSADMRKIQHHYFDQPIPIEIGTELGYFDFGSTVVLVTEKAVKFSLSQGCSTTVGMPFASTQ